MGILNSFNIGVTGLRAAGESMSVTGDNIANSQTFGFKSSRAEFQDMLSRSLKEIDGGDQIGSGTTLAHVTPKFSQGNIARTESLTDLAINGNGFFMVDASFGRGYTRDGTFRFDKEGYMTNGDGYKVFGFMGGEEGEGITNKVGNIKIGNTTIPANPSSNVTMSLNLDSREIIKQFNPLEPDKSSSFNTSVTVYDNVGTARLITLYFNKVAEGQYQYHAMVDGKDAAGGIEGQMVEMASGTLLFNNKGQLQQETSTANSFNFNKGAAPGQVIDFDFGNSIAEGGDGFDASTYYGSDSTVARHTQDGSQAGTLSSLSFNDDGILSAVYSNGVVREVAQVALAKFENNEALFKTGKNLFKESRKSGEGALGRPGVDGRGEILSKSIELSNVDLADEFINLMNAQRTFTANTKTIQTADQMLQEILGIKR